MQWNVPRSQYLDSFWRPNSSTSHCWHDNRMKEHPTKGQKASQQVRTFRLWLACAYHVHPWRCNAGVQKCLSVSVYHSFWAWPRQSRQRCAPCWSKQAPCRSSSPATSSWDPRQPAKLLLSFSSCCISRCTSLPPLKEALCPLPHLVHPFRSSW